MTINLYLCVSLFFIFGLAIPTILVFTLKNHQKVLKILAGIMLAVYFIFLLIGTTAKIDISLPNASFYLDFSSNWFEMNFIAFGTGKSNILINLVLFLPLGFVVFIFSKKRPLLKTIMFSLTLSITIELLQWILPITRNTEILDVILNTISGTISAIFCYFLKKLGAFNTKETIKKEVN